MHHYKQSRKQVAIRFFSYGVLTVAVLVLSGIGILSVLGYQFDFDHRSLEQTALIQFASQPGGAQVSVDGKKVTGNTNTRTNVAGGSHTATVSLDGYRSWSKTFSVTPGTVLWLNYALLIPNSIKTAPVHELGTVASDKTSPDKKWRLVTLADKPQTLTLVDLTDPRNPDVSSSAVPADILSKADDGSLGTLEAVSWDSGSRYALLRHTYGNVTEYIRYDRQNPDALRNITKELGITGIDKIGFSDASGNTYYALASGDIRKLDLGGSISGPLVTDVTQMYYADGGETVAYARVQDGVTSVGVYRDAGGAVTTNTYAATPANLQLTYGGSYYGYRYLATYHDGRVYLVQSPDTRQPKVVKTVDLPAVDSLSFSPSGRLLVAQTGNTFMAYDIETDRVYNATLGAADGAMKFSWIDDFHLMSTAGGRMNMSDFDGGNPIDLGPADAGRGVQLSNNAQWLFSIRTDGGKTQVQRTALRVQ